MCVVHDGKLQIREYFVRLVVEDYWRFLRFYGLLYGLLIRLPNRAISMEASGRVIGNTTLGQGTLGVGSVVFDQGVEARL